MAAAAAAAADAAAAAAPYHHRRHRLLRTAAVVQLPVPVPAGHLYNKRGPGQVPGGIGNNNINSHIGIGGAGGGILHGGIKGQRQPFLQRLPSRIHDLTRAIEMAVSGAANTATQQQQQQQQRQHAQAKQTSLKNKPNNKSQAGSKKLQQSEKV